MKILKDFGAGTKTLMYNFFVAAFGLRLGFQYSPIIHRGSPYMTRWIVYMILVNFRLHQFFRGDSDRESHTHPWWFITFPFRPYLEAIYHHGKHVEDRCVKAWRFHYRPADFEHRVICGLREIGYDSANKRPIYQVSKEPFWTFVIASGRAREWGFYDEKGKFIPWREYTDAQP